MGDCDEIPVVVPIEETTPHNLCTPPDQFRDGLAVYQPPRRPQLPREPESRLHVEHVVWYDSPNRVFIQYTYEASAENTDVSGASERPDNVIDVPENVPHENDQRTMKLALGLCIIGGGGVIVITIALLDVPGAVIRWRIAQYFRQALGHALDIVAPVTASTLPLALCRRPISYGFPTRVIGHPLSTVTMRIINQHISRRVFVLLLRR